MIERGCERNCAFVDEIRVRLNWAWCLDGLGWALGLHWGEIHSRAHPKAQRRKCPNHKWISRLVQLKVGSSSSLHFLLQRLPYSMQSRP